MADANPQERKQPPRLHDVYGKAEKEKRALEHDAQLEAAEVKKALRLVAEHQIAEAAAAAGRLPTMQMPDPG